VKSYIASDVRDVNRNTVFRLLRLGGETSRAELTRLTGISSPTVIKIVEFMKEKGLVEESGAGSPTVGRKPQMIRLNKDAASAVGVILEGEYLRASIVNLAGDIYPSSLRRAGADLQESMTVILPEMIESLLALAHVDRASIRGIGLGIPGGYDPNTHVVNFAPLIRLTGPTCIAPYERALGERFAMPVVVDNDVNMAVLGEYRARALDGADLIYLSLGTGIGAGVMLGGALRHGNTWQCGEIGYMTFMDNYVPGHTHPGWLESRINLSAVREKFGFDPYHVEKALLPDVTDHISVPLAICISNVVSLLDCDTVVLGGILTQSLGNVFLESVRAKVQELCVLNVSVERQLCVDPGVLGAASVVLDRAIKAILSEQE
jgi:predicted NBD/HSP70 family sugar kinase